MSERRERDAGLEETIQAESTPSTDGLSATTPASDALGATTPASDALPLADTIPPAQPDLIGRYRIRGILGRGGMGVVYIGYDENLEREVAIKLVRATAAGGTEGPTRLKREAKIMAQLSHPNLVAVHEVGEHEGRVYVAMELIKGLTLRRWLRKQDREWRDVLDVYLAAGEGLAAAHKVGVIHRDFKPDNVIVADDGRVRVLDFGLARPVDAPAQRPEPSSDRDAPAHLTMTGTIMGTPAYMPPEQHEGRITDARADQFSYCVSLFEALYGGRPFVGTSVAELAEATTRGEVAERPDNTNVPRKLHEAILRGLRRDPDDRWGSMTELTAELARASRSHAPKLWVAGVGVVVAALVVALLWARSGGGAPPLDDTCRPIARQLGEAWDDAAKAELKQRFDGLNKPYAGDVYASFVRDVAAYASAWTDAQRQICDRGTKRNRLLRAQQLTCLDDHLLRLRGYLAAAREVNIEALSLGFEGYGEPTAAECLNEKVVRARAAAPPANITEAVNDQRLRLYRAQAHVALHQFTKLARLTPYLVSMRDASEALHKLGQGAARAEALYYLGRALGYVGKLDQAKTVLERAIEIAESNRADTTVAALLTRLIHQRAFHGGSPAQVKALIKRANIALERAGRPAWISGQLLYTQAHIANLAGHPGKATTFAQRGYNAYSRALPPQSHRLAQIESDLARFAALLGKTDVQRAHLRVALDLYERLLGTKHPHLGELLARLALALDTAPDQRRAGRAAARRALRVLVSAAGQPSPWLGRALVTTGEALEHYGLFGEAADAFAAAARSLQAVAPRSNYALVSALSRGGELAWHYQLDAISADTRLSKAIALGASVYPNGNADTLRARLALANVRLGQGRYEQAKQLALEVWQPPAAAAPREELDRFRFAAAGVLARSYASARQFGQADDYLAKMNALATLPRQKTWALVTEGHVALLRDQPVVASKRFGDALAHGTLAASAAATVRGYLAVARARAGQLARAEQPLKQAVSRDPDKGHPLGILARFELAKLLWQRKRDRAAAKNQAQKARRALRRFSPKRKRTKKAIDRWLKIR